MNFEVLECHGADAARWHSFWMRLPSELRDIHYCPGYARAHESLNGRPLCAVVTHNDWFMMQPFLLRNIAVGKGIVTFDPTTCWRDVRSFYGFGGPLSNWVIGGDIIAAGMRDALAVWYSDNRVVSEFTAWHPLFVDNHRRLTSPYAGRPANLAPPAKEVVLLDVTNSEEHIITGMSRNRQRGIKAARASGVEVKPDVAEWSLPTFKAFYDASMNRKGASQRLRFHPDIWDDYAREFAPDRMEILFAHASGMQHAGLLILHGGRVSYAHMLGSKTVEPIKPPGTDDMLYLHGALAAHRVGASWFHLGGGLTGAADDPLFQYKAGFSPHRAPLYVHKRIIDAVAYRDLCRAAGVDMAVEQPFFPAYRRAEAA